jgi:hypothetical protein
MIRNRALRTAAGVAAGLLAWIITATLCNLLVRAALPGYREAEPGMNFTFTMQVCRLLTSAAASIACGLIAARVAHDSKITPLLSGLLLLLLFIPVHLSLWARFPVWYHLTFLASLPVLPMLSARANGQAAPP